MIRALLLALLLSPLTFSAQTLCDMGMAGPYPCENIDLMYHMPTSVFGSGIEFNDIWGWTDQASGREFALLGKTNGTAFIEVTDPLNPVYLGQLSTNTSNSLWRDIKVHGNFAYIGSEAGGHGMQVFDLSKLLTVGAPPETFTADAVYTGFGNSHNIVINPAVARAYGVGTNTASGGLHIVDISNPLAPVILGDYALDGYTHDAQVVTYSGPDVTYQGMQIGFNCNEDALTIANLEDATDTQTISVTGYSGSAYCHQGWLTPDQQYFLSNDELDESQQGINTRTLIWDVTDLDLPVLIGSYYSSIGAIDHNLYTDGNLCFQSNYRGGVRILDIQDVANANLSEVAFFDLYPSSDSPNFNGTWSNYPYFDSGIVIASHIEEGLFILRPHFIDVATAESTVCGGDDYLIDVTLDTGFEGPITMSVDPPLPAGFGVSFSANGVGPGTYTATISTPLTFMGLDMSDIDVTIKAEGAHFSYTQDVTFTWVDCASVILGCTDPIAENYDPAATLDDGSCTYIPGCTDPLALNYDPAATQDDGSCTYPCTDVTIDILTDCWGSEVTFELRDAATNLVASGGPFGNQTSNLTNVCLVNGCYDFTILDSFGDGMSGASYGGCGVDGNYTVTLDSDGSVLIQMLVANYGSSETQQFCVTANIDGCTDMSACNYNPAATTDDGSCEFTSCAGCINPGACNFDPTATIDDGSCEFLTCAGCTDAAACNYNAAATIDNGSCISATTWYADDDADGFGDPADELFDCVQPAGYVANMTDCDPLRTDVYPGAPGTGEGIDNNCDGMIVGDEEAPACPADLDNNGQYGVGDLLIILADFGCTSACVGDVDGDGLTGTGDLLTLIALFGLFCP